jgi:carbon storage regulator
MLILTRKLGEDIVIHMADGRTATITVVEIDRNQVRIGIEAPKDCYIRRAELPPPERKAAPAAG